MATWDMLSILQIWTTSTLTGTLLATSLRSNPFQQATEHAGRGQDGHGGFTSQESCVLADGSIVAVFQPEP
jgi:hypothetical protein